MFSAAALNFECVYVYQKLLVDVIENISLELLYAVMTPETTVEVSALLEKSGCSVI